MPPGRPPNITPKTAYDYRRYITLVQTIAAGDYALLYALLLAWGVDLTGVETDSAGSPTYAGLCKYLAAFVIEFSTEELSK